MCISRYLAIPRIETATFYASVKTRLRKKLEISTGKAAFAGLV
jgi:hypothetical protein